MRAGQAGASGGQEWKKKLPTDIRTQEEKEGDLAMQFTIPEPLKAEHEELHAELVRATQARGRVGEAAKDVAKVLHPHFLKEEEFALPPLGLLTSLAKGDVTSEMSRVVAMTDKLKEELPEMLREHKVIVAALRNLREAAKQDNQMEYARFADKLTLHAQTEEEVMYPTSILIGEYVRLRLQK